ncbi:hypothetical protein [Dyella silvatica]|uniref:hypothetical protein n=1 Tax=Dyella silvatica TaxID=2992128 RepID=UPI0022523BD6|nr:hypothetical protein [Dyella silvatica]
METIHVVQPFDRSSKGLVPGKVQQMKTPEEAARKAERMASQYAGVTAYSMDIDEAAGFYSEPRILFTAGEVPELG